METSQYFDAIRGLYSKKVTTIKHNKREPLDDTTLF